MTSTRSRIPNERANCVLELLGEAARGQPEVQRGIHQRAAFLRVEDASGDGHRAIRPARNLAGERRVVILALPSSRIRLRNSSAGLCVHLQKLPIPGDGPVQTLVQREQRLPAQHVAGLGSRSGTGCGSRWTPHSGRPAAAKIPSRRRMRLHQIEHGHLDLVRKIERLPAQVGIGSASCSASSM